MKKCSLKKYNSLRDNALKYKHDYPISKKGEKAIRKYQKFSEKCGK